MDIYKLKVLYEEKGILNKKTCCTYNNNNILIEKFLYQLYLSL